MPVVKKYKSLPPGHNFNLPAALPYYGKPPNAGLGPVSKKPKGGKTNSKHDWNVIRAEYLRQNMERPRGSGVFTLKNLADHYKIPYVTIRDKSSSQHWHKLLSNLLVARDSTTELHDMVKGELATDRLAEDEVNREVNVRVRHARFGRAMQAKALERLAKVDPADLRVFDAIALLRLSIEVERDALGIAKAGTLEHAQEGGNKSYASVAQAVTEQEQLRELGVKFLKHLTSKRQAAGATEGELVEDASPATVPG